MPWKVRQVLQREAARSVTTSSFLKRTRRWDPVCGRPEEVTTSLDGGQADDPVPFTVATRAEGILYGNSLYKRFNDCAHVDTRVSGSPHKFVLQKSQDVTNEYDYEACGDEDYTYERVETLDEVTIRDPLVGYLPAVPEGPSFVDDYLGDSTNIEEKLAGLELLAFEAMLPRLDAGWSAPRALFELLELKMLYKQAAEFLKLGQTLRKLLKRPLNQMSQHYLATIFGVLPLVDDVKEFVTRFRTVARQVERYLGSADTRLTMHYQKALHPETFQPATWFEPTTHGVSYSFEDNHEIGWYARDVLPEEFFLHFTHSRAIQKLVYHNTMVYKYSLPLEQYAALQYFLAEMDVWGINLSISDVWEVIPFSFVVDWVVDIGSWLERFDFENVPPTVVVYDQCRSVKYLHVQKLQFDSCSPAPWFPDTTHDTTHVESRVYYRSAGIRLPEKSKWPELNIPSGMQFVIGAALAAARKR